MLIDVIEEAQAQVESTYNTWQHALSNLRELEKRRVECEHKFTYALPGYEHEGGYCSKCGINEVHARSNKIGKFK